MRQWSSEDRAQLTVLVVVELAQELYELVPVSPEYCLDLRRLPRVRDEHLSITTK